MYSYLTGWYSDRLLDKQTIPSYRGVSLFKKNK